MHCTSNFQFTCAQCFYIHNVPGPVQGYVSLAFPERINQMVPADAVIGWLSPDGLPSINTHHLGSYKAKQISADSSNSTWASHMGVVMEGGLNTMCFSRPLHSARARVQASIEPQGGFLPG